MARIRRFAIELGLRQDGQRLHVTWPTNAAGFVLKSTSTLTNGAAWQDRTDLVPRQTNGQNVVTFSSTHAASFFRLR